MPLQLELAYVSARRQRMKSAPAQALVDDFLQRAGRYTPVRSAAYASETALLEAFEKSATRAGALVLLDSRGRALSSEEFAGYVGRQRDGGAQHMTVAVGPADGWSPAAWSRADLSLAFGAMIFPHELALVLAAEQIYRALSILAGHPYHSGHS